MFSNAPYYDYCDLYGSFAYPSPLEWADYVEGLIYSSSIQMTLARLVRLPSSPFLFIKRFFRRTLFSKSGWLPRSARNKMKDQEGV